MLKYAKSFLGKLNELIELNRHIVTSFNLTIESQLDPIFDVILKLAALSPKVVRIQSFRVKIRVEASRDKSFLFSCKLSELL